MVMPSFYIYIYSKHFNIVWPNFLSLIFHLNWRLFPSDLPSIFTMALTRRLAILGFWISMLLVTMNPFLARELKDDTSAVVKFPYKSLGILETYISPPTMGVGGSQICDPKKDPAICQQPPENPWRRSCEKELRCRSAPPPAPWMEVMELMD